jgi:hypothetical protein
MLVATLAVLPATANAAATGSRYPVTAAGQTPHQPAPAATATIAGSHVRKAQSNSCLVARIGSGERPVQQSACADFSDQGWDFFTGFRNGVAVNQIHNIDRNQCIVTRGGGETVAVTTGCDLRPFDQVFADQLWIAVWDDSFGGGVHFVNFNSGNCLVARGTSQAVQSICGHFSDQVWQIF